MGRYRKLDLSVWSDDKFMKLSPAAPSGQHLWLYLLLGPHTTALPGLSRIGEAALAEALGWPMAKFRKCFQELQSFGMVKADWDMRVLWLPKAICYNQPANPNVVRGWKDRWDEIPPCPLKEEAWRTYMVTVKAVTPDFKKALTDCFGTGNPDHVGNDQGNSSSNGSSNGLLNRSPNGLPNQEQEQEQVPPPPPQGGSDGFDEFWTEYPRKTDKAEARRAWNKLRPGDKLRAEIMAGLRRWKQSEQWNKEGGQFIPYAQKFLNRQRWQVAPAGTPVEPVLTPADIDAKVRAAREKEARERAEAKAAREGERWAKRTEPRAGRTGTSWT